MHLATAFRRLVTWHGDRIAVSDASGDWTFHRFFARVAQFGQAMVALGLKPGDRIGLLLPDVREYVESDYGAMAGGFVRVPMDPRAGRDDLRAQMRHVEVAAVVIHASLVDALGDILADVPSLRHVIAVGGEIGGASHYEDLLAGAPPTFRTAGDEDDLATLNFSGGTTGSPKAIMQRHRNLFTVAQNTISLFDIAPADVFLNVRPLWPIAQVIMLSHVLAGARIVLGGRFDPGTFADQIARDRVTRTSLVPTQLMRCLDDLVPGDMRLTTLQALYIGGSRIPPQVFERAFEIIGPKIGVLYGLTEAPICCYLHPDQLAADRALMSSVGRSAFGYEVALAGAGNDPSPDATGEVVVRGGNVMAGYWTNAEATAAALQDGWLHTGDIGQFDAHGNLHIVGRIKDVIRSGSTSIVPKEVEDAIATHPAVAEVAVLGTPDLEWGEAVTAFIVLKDGMQASELEILDHCRKHLAPHKKPKTVHFRDSLPRSHYGKVLRNELLAS